MSDKRSVSTDALETLGFIHQRDEKRDAIHLAVIPVKAAQTLRPGARIIVTPTGAAMNAPSGEGVGIVDPFLTEPVLKGERFWCVLMPRTIQSLRHVWSHQAFPDEPVTNTEAPVETDAVKAAMAQIRELAADLDCSAERLMDGAAEFLETGECLFFGYDLDYHWDAARFWRCYATVTGKLLAEEPGYFFRCAC